MKTSRAAAAGLVVASLFATPFGAAYAGASEAQKELKPIKVSVKTAAGQGSARFDWLANRNPNPQPATRTVRARMLGHGTWVCSPSGFGRRASCSQR